MKYLGLACDSAKWKRDLYCGIPVQIRVDEDLGGGAGKLICAGGRSPVMERRIRMALGLPGGIRDTKSRHYSSELVPPDPTPSRLWAPSAARNYLHFCNFL